MERLQETQAAQDWGRGSTAIEKTVSLRKKRGVFFGWWIALASFVSFGLSGGFYYYGFSVFLLPLEQEFGWSRTALSGAISLARVEGGFAGPVAGFLVDRFGPRRIMALGMLLAGVGFLLFSRIDSILGFYLIFVLVIAVGCSLGITGPPLYTVAKWFVRKRGLAMGVATSGMGLGGLMVPILGWITAEFGWRQASVVAGFAIWAIGLPLVALMRGKPELYGQLPDGLVLPGRDADADGKNVAIGRSVATEVAEQNYTAKQALRAPVFWLMALAFGLRQLVVSAVAIHEIPFLVDMGISLESAAAALGSLAVVSVTGRLGFGWLGDRYDKKKVMAVTVALLGVGCLILANFSSWWQIIPFLIVYAPAYGGGSSLMFALRGEYFGRESFGTISGLMDFIQMFGLVLGPIFAGLVFDVTGSYQAAFYIFTVAVAVATIIFLCLRKPSLKAAVLV